MYWYRSKHNSAVPKDVYEYFLNIEHGNFCATLPKIFLYGSRSFMGFPEQLHSEESDVDVAIEYDAFLEEALYQDGWTRKDYDISYQDLASMFCMEKDFKTCKVQIGFKNKNFDNFRQVWYSLSEEVYKALLWKQSPCYLQKDGVRRFIDDQISLVIGSSTPKTRGEVRLFGNVVAVGAVF